MAGASIEIRIDDKGVKRGFDRLSRAMRDTTPVMRTIGDGLVASTTRRFVTQSGPDGSAWAALNPEYASGKRNTRILTESGRLRGSITRDAGRTEVRVGSNVIYAAIHQFGGTITPKNASHLVFRIGGRLVKAKSVTLPARPYLGISGEDRDMIERVVTAYLRRVLPR